MNFLYRGGTRRIERRILAMGTEVLIKLVCRSTERERAHAALERIATLMQDFGAAAWAWGPGVLATFNRKLYAGALAELPAELHPLFLRAWEIRQRSGGLFEPRVAALVRLWGFDDVARLRQSPPSTDEIETCLRAQRAAPDYDGSLRYGPAPGLGWDFGGIGKGYIVDRALTQLGEMGFANAVVDAGGNLAARGRCPARRWRIGIRDPRAAGSLLASLDVSDEAVITHGDDQRCFEYGGRRYAHILHPQTGQSVHGLRALTVVHADGTLADAGGAALYVAGPCDWHALAQRLGIGEVLVLLEDGRVQVTASLARRLRFEQALAVEIV